MDSVTVQVVLLWVAVALYAVSAVLLSIELVFHRDWRWLGWAVPLATVALVPHGVAILVRWVEVQHGPYVTFYEVTASQTWIATALYAGAAWRYPRLRLTGAVVLPICFLFLGAAVFSPKEGRELLPVLRSFWLVLHVLFAKLAYGPYLLGLGAAVLYLLGKRNVASVESLSRRLGDPALLDELVYRLVAFGFLMHAVMIVAGAIWAKQAWGSYWSWDAIETWSLVSWLAFGVLLHLRVVHGWQGNRAALATIGAVILVVFAFIGVPFLGGSHAPIVAF